MNQFRLLVTFEGACYVSELSSETVRTIGAVSLPEVFRFSKKVCLGPLGLESCRRELEILGDARIYVHAKSTKHDGDEPDIN